MYIPSDIEYASEYFLTMSYLFNIKGLYPTFFEKKLFLTFRCFLVL